MEKGTNISMLVLIYEEDSPFFVLEVSLKFSFCPKFVLVTKQTLNFAYSPNHHSAYFHSIVHLLHHAT
jgi:hypothetical protein